MQMCLLFISRNIHNFFLGDWRKMCKNQKYDWDESNNRHAKKNKKIRNKSSFIDFIFGWPLCVQVCVCVECASDERGLIFNRRQYSCLHFRSSKVDYYTYSFSAIWIIHASLYDIFWCCWCLIFKYNIFCTEHVLYVFKLT